MNFLNGDLSKVIHLQKPLKYTIFQFLFSKKLFNIKPNIDNWVYHVLKVILRDTKICRIYLCSEGKSTVSFFEFL